MKKFLRSFLDLLGLTLIALYCHMAVAQSYPNKPVHIVVSYAAGGGVDIMARVLAEQLSRQINQPVIVENKPGASGSIGIEQVVRSAPDRPLRQRSEDVPGKIEPQSLRRMAADLREPFRLHFGALLGLLGWSGVDLERRRIAWEHKLAGGVFGSPAISDGGLLVVTQDGVVSAWR